MLIALSPAKALDFSRVDETLPISTPELSGETAQLAKTTRRLTVRDLKRLMSLSDSLAKLNRERFQAFDPESDDGLQAAFAFNGDVYQGLQARTLDKKSLAWAQEHVRILSGLYGLLRPLDAIQPYRLEMGARLKTRRGQSLYDFWGDRVSKALNAAAADHPDPTLVNAASSEYAGVIDRKALKVPLVTVRFLEEKDGEQRMLGFFAKKARGLFARYAIDHRIDRAEGLKAFDTAGYRFAPELSTDDVWAFSRPQPAPPGAKAQGA
jgi:cytoplasmic iron level regulating protein YaaA (DUF328/UPF0246 family)